MNRYSIIFLILFFLQTACKNDSTKLRTPDVETDISFGNSREITIQGYMGDTQEPFISRDGSLLFFNKLKSGTLPNGDENDTNIHYAIRVNDVTFN